jgi:hypothetical protein
MVIGIFTVDEAKICMLLYADDAVLFATTQEALQHLVNEVKTYSENWNLNVNTAKTKIMVFEKRGASNPEIYFGTKKLEVVSCLNTWAYNFSKKENWSRSQKRIAYHAAFALHKLYMFLGES